MEGKITEMQTKMPSTPGRKDAARTTTTDEKCLERSSIKIVNARKDGNRKPTLKSFKNIVEPAPTWEHIEGLFSPKINLNLLEDTVNSRLNLKICADQPDGGTKDSRTPGTLLDHDWSDWTGLENEGPIGGTVRFERAVLDKKGKLRNSHHRCV